MAVDRAVLILDEVSPQLPGQIIGIWEAVETRRARHGMQYVSNRSFTRQREGGGGGVPSTGGVVRQWFLKLRWWGSLAVVTTLYERGFLGRVP